MRAVAYPGGVQYTGRISSGGYVGPVVTVRPGIPTAVVDGGHTIHVRPAATEEGPPGRRCLQLEIRCASAARYVQANALREHD